MNIKILCILGMLCLGLAGNAQKQEDTTRIGLLCPDFVLNDILHYKSKSTSISALKGKWIILDFWATWCGACIGEFPTLDSLQKTYNDHVQIFAVSTEKKTKVIDFLERREKVKGVKLSFPVVPGDTALYDYFPHQYIPHVIWINPQGRIAAITDGDKITKENIEEAIAKSQIHLPEKKDVISNFDISKPLFNDFNGGKADDIYYYQILSKGYRPGLVGSAIVDTITNRILIQNNLLVQLYKTAYGGYRQDLQFGISAGFTENRTFIYVKDSSVFFPKDINSGLYNYDMIEPKAKGSYKTTYHSHLTMQLCLENVLPYKVTVIKKKMKCLVLTRTKHDLPKISDVTAAEFNQDRYAIHIRNTPFLDLFNQLRYINLQLDNRPLLNETGISGNVDLDLEGNLSDAESLAKTFRANGYDLIEAEREIDVLVITDKIEMNPSSKIE